MQKPSIHIFFSLIFIAFLTAPAIVPLIDDSVDISFFYELNEEEGENEEHEVTKDIELIVTQLHDSDNSLIRTKRNVIPSDESWYLQFYLNISTPPPERHI